MTTDLDALLALHEAATPGPWRADVLGSEGYAVTTDRPPNDGRPRRLSKLRVARCGHEDWDTDKANAEFIAEVRNALPELLERVEAAERERSAILRALPHDWREQYERAEKAESRLTQIIKLHEPDDRGWCSECSTSPCATFALLSGRPKEERVTLQHEELIRDLNRIMESKSVQVARLRLAVNESNKRAEAAEARVAFLENDVTLANLYDDAQDEITDLRAERDVSLARVAHLEAGIKALADEWEADDENYNCGRGTILRALLNSTDKDTE